LENDEKWVEVFGEGTKCGFVGEESSFTVQFSGSLGVETKGPAKLDLVCDGNFLDIFSVNKVSGKYPNV